MKVVGIIKQRGEHHQEFVYNPKYGDPSNSEGWARGKTFDCLGCTTVNLTGATECFSCGVLIVYLDPETGKAFAPTGHALLKELQMTLSSHSGTDVQIAAPAPAAAESIPTLSQKAVAHHSKYFGNVTGQTPHGLIRGQIQNRVKEFMKWKSGFENNGPIPGTEKDIRSMANQGFTPYDIHSISDRWEVDFSNIYTFLDPDYCYTVGSQENVEKTLSKCAIKIIKSRPDLPAWDKDEAAKKGGHPIWKLLEADLDREARLAPPSFFEPREPS